MTASFLPEIVEDELLFGFLSRHRRSVGLPPASKHVETMFGHRTTVAALDLPVGLSALAERVGSGFDADRLTYDHTLFPYYTAHQTDDRRKKALQAVRSGDGGSMKTALGLVAFRIQPLNNLRYCPVCVMISAGQVGEECWLRAHQLPGSLVCHLHGASLLLADASERGRHEFWAPDPVSLPMTGGVAFSDTVRERLQLVAAAQAAMLGGQPAHDFDHWGPHYHRRLARAGFVPAGRQVEQVRLEDAFLTFYDTSLELLPPAVSSLGEHGWLAAMPRRHRKAVHPLLHALLNVFLDAQADSMGPFGVGPWPCLNPLADHYSETVIATMTHYANRSARIGVFVCGCGYAYTRGLSPAGIVGPPRLRSGGPLMEAALRRLVKPDASLREVGRLTGLDPKTVVREAASLGLALPWSTKPSGKPKAVAADPLQRQMKGRNRTPSGIRRDWQALDGDTVKELIVAEAAIRVRVPPGRVSYEALERETVGRGWLRKRAAKMPRSHALAHAMSETIEAFQRRRTQAIITALPTAQAWKVMRAAGLKGSELKMVHDLMRGESSPSL
ncbi:TnsD family Tn7-like transposition protein [Sphingomonas sp. LB2R24]|uniref:TnsD family Tn7-like transposition protein n=1 Tax=Sphingomonas sorbitolis TaxID=3096165 RepID=UPI002FC5B2C1